MSKQPEKKSGGGKKVLLIIFILLLAGINGFQVWMHFQNEEKHKIEIAEKDTEIEGLKTQADSLINQLNMRMTELSKLGEDTAALGAQIRNLEQIRADLERTKNAGWAKYRQVKSQLAGYKELLLKKDKEIAAKDSLLNVQKANIDSLTVDKNQLMAEKTELTNERDELQTKVELASVMKAENIAITFLKSNGKEYSKEPFKGKKIDKLKIAFNLSKNPVAETGTKQISVRITEPDGTALYDLATGGGSFTIEGKEIFYSAKQDIMFANKNEKVNFMYSKGSEWKEGPHKIEIFEGSNLIGVKAFLIK